MITTKKGDEGLTDFWGKRLKKDDKLIEAIGAIDELQAVLGGLGLEEVQEDLYQIMSRQLEEKRVAFLDREIKRLESKIRVPKVFIIFKVSQAIYFNWIRTIARRAERRAIALGDKNAIKYLNRLSDYLYLLALREEQR